MLLNFILSEKRTDRLKRHVVFWFAWWVYFAVLHAANPFNKPEISYFRNPVFTFTESVFLVLPHIPLTYGMLYLVLGKFILKKKYALAVFTTITLWLVGGIVHFYLISDMLPKILTTILPERFTAGTQRPPSASFFMAVLATYKGAFMISAIALVLKFGKYWYLKEQRNLQLQKENTEAQLKLLTAQVHPHFLFNTLNNIYSQTQTESPRGSKMIMELSDMMRYILAEGSKAKVPLEKELAMIQDYINLEKVRYGNKLDLHLSLPEETRGLQIAPLILLPFVENCFKHGASKFLTAPWINLKIELKENSLLLKLMNGKDEDQIQRTPKSGTGIPNVKERLRLLYPGKHQLQISDENEVFVINLRLELTECSMNEAPITQPQPTFSYV
jgi:hypothetical protein